ncbi:hypothetical protein [Luteibaculum oceani]|uniref:Uncharacterized protein n=1 Tax=Luteibaculum oceani TaxID=1294296 RepID=A0A5C6UZ25_9FLAO|nr:hypothetical protein [Luteibaculum oceani]TXC78527.1 hypothetical protein FRX97_07350 [Luteibaculum oceani]
MLLGIILQVLSWEERARLLTKYWIAGIALALISVGVFLWVQFKRKKKAKAKFEKRGMKPKKDIKVPVVFSIADFDSVQQEVKSVLNKNWDGKDCLIAQSQKGENLLVAVVMQKKKSKLVIKEVHSQGGFDLKQIHWVLRRVINSKAINGYGSINFFVKEKSPIPLLDILEAFGFKRVKLGKKQETKYEYGLKYQIIN